jgi:hypothetical protein
MPKRSTCPLGRAACITASESHGEAARLALNEIPKTAYSSQARSVA